MFNVRRLRKEITRILILQSCVLTMLVGGSIIGVFPILSVGVLQCCYSAGEIASMKTSDRSLVSVVRAMKSYSTESIEQLFSAQTTKKENKPTPCMPTCVLEHRTGTVLTQ